MVDLEYLTLVHGQSLEIIESKLREAGVDFDISEDIPVTFFREHMVRVDNLFKLDYERKTTKGKAIKILGYPDRYSWGNLFYYAKYKIEEGFDFSKLHGKVTFEQGLLVERTKVWFRYK